jgi:hypothetical protein
MPSLRLDRVSSARPSESLACRNDPWRIDRDAAPQRDIGHRAAAGVRICQSKIVALELRVRLQFAGQQTAAQRLLASAGCKANIARAKELMAAPMPAVDPPVAHDTADPHATTDHRPPCPCCGGRMIIVEVFARGGAPRGPPSYGAGIRI